MSEEYNKIKAELEAQFKNPARYIAAWLEANPDLAPKAAAKKVENKAPKEEKPAEKAEE